MKKNKNKVAAVATIIIAAIVIITLLFARKDNVKREDTIAVENTVTEEATVEVVENTVVENTTGINKSAGPMATSYTDYSKGEKSSEGTSVKEYKDEKAEKAMEAENAAIEEALTSNVNVSTISIDGVENDIVVVEKKEETPAPAEVTPATPTYGEATLTTEDEELEKIDSQESQPTVEPQNAEESAEASATPVVEENDIAKDKTLDALLNATM